MSTESVKSRYGWFQDGFTAIRGAIICALVVLFLDVACDGSYLFSALICPIWFVVAIVRNITQRSSPGVIAARLLMPIIIFLLVIANSSLQKRIAMDHGAQIVQACKQYREATGSYPKRLNDLVPRYMSSIPMAKYCLSQGEFMYFTSEDDALLVWCEIPPFGRRIYNFERSSWNYLD